MSAAENLISSSFHGGALGVDGRRLNCENCGHAVGLTMYFIHTYLSLNPVATTLYSHFLPLVLVVCL
jgi:hypothetical protein